MASELRMTMTLLPHDHNRQLGGSVWEGVWKLCFSGIPVSLSKFLRSKYRNFMFFFWILLRVGGDGEGETLSLEQCHQKDDESWVVVSNIFYLHPYLGKIPILTNIFQLGWNHQLESDVSKHDLWTNVGSWNRRLGISVSFRIAKLLESVNAMKLFQLSCVPVELKYVFLNQLF